MFLSKKRFHLVGIGGSGMNALANILLQMGLQVSGSDINKTHITEELESKGAEIHYDHKSENIINSEVIVFSDAVPNDNPEILEAKRKDLFLLKRIELLNEILKLHQYSLCVTGTHGKTTTTSILGHILKTADLNPTIITGGYSSNMKSSAELGNLCYAAAEADEYNKSFLRLSPSLTIVTSIEPEHLECYNNDFTALKEAYKKFAFNIPFYGKAVIYGDQETGKELINQNTKKAISYGFSSENQVQAINISLKDSFSLFNINYFGSIYEDFRLNIPGEYNILNALAAVSASGFLGIDLETVKKGLSTFTGVKRRFEIKKKTENTIIIDDFAHHPTEIKEALKAASNFNKKITAVFQPHLYSRTKNFYKEIAKSLTAADKIIITKIYPAREKPINGVTGSLIKEEIEKISNIKVIYEENFDEIENIIIKDKNEDELIITIGAGDIYKVSDKLAQKEFCR